MMQELTSAFPILSWLVFLCVITALIIWVKSDRQVIGKSTRAMAGFHIQGLTRGEVFPSMMRS
jgi:hypothetical protein